MCRPTPPPAKGALAVARIPNRQIARQLDCSERWVSAVLNGHVPAPARFQRVVAELLGRPEVELFPENKAPAVAR